MKNSTAAPDGLNPHPGPFLCVKLSAQEKMLVTPVHKC